MWSGLRLFVVPPFPTRWVLWCLVTLLVVFQMMRLVFWAMHGAKALDPSFDLLLDSFLVGTRFDLAAAGILLLLLALLVHVAYAAAPRGRFRRVALALFIATGVAATLTTFGDCVYYGYAAKRISYEPAVMFDVGFEVLEFSFGEHPVLMPAMIFAILATWGVAGLLLDRVREREGDFVHARSRAIVWGILALGFLLVGVRGSLLGSRLRIGDAYHSNDVVVNHTALNPVYTSAMSIVEDRGRYRLMPHDDAVATVRATVSENAGDDAFGDDEFPMIRRHRGRADPELRNVVILLMESLSAETIGAFGNPHGATPNIDRLIADGVLFERFIASGSRSSSGLIATLCSVPAQLGRPVTHTSMMLDNFRGLGRILNEVEYDTTFIYGGVYDFTNAHGFLKNGGFETIIGEPLDPVIERRTWGYDDEHMLDRLLHELETNTDCPQFVTLFTQNLHGRDVPESFVKAQGGLRYPESMDGDRYYNLLWYTDWCIGRFFDEARGRAFFDDTIFLMVSDHTNHRNPNLYEDRHIPFLVYAPKLLRPARHRTVGGQCDILPTVLGLLGLDAVHASFGQDLLAAAARGAEGHAYFTYGDSIGWTEGSWIIQDLFESGITKLYNLDDDPLTQHEVSAAHPERARRMAKRARAFLQLSRDLLVENRVAPLRDASKVRAN